jgi:cbb3-type cytochrome oxidase maturation protein
MIAKYKPGEPLEATPVYPGRQPVARRTRLFLWIFSGTLVLTAGTAFLFKLIEFIYTATTHGSQALASFLIPVLNYLMVAAGFMFLFLWAYSTGQFRDVEGTKYRMLAMQEEIDRSEAKGEKRGAKSE